VTDEKFLRSWPQTRRHGFWRFFLWRAAVIASICAIVVGRFFMISRDAGFPSGLAAGLVFFAIVGMTFIPVVWRAREARYRRLSGERARTAFE
jgi:membrane protein YdbS with pleckstrin-like domain